jgi:LPPG:FO 2-phospho-L-lactate transferase
MLRGLGHEVSVRGVARLYRGLVDVFVLDRRDAAWAPRVEALGMRTVVADTIMTTHVRAARLAAAVLRALDEPRAHARASA